ncbi:TM2 domain-containing protein [Nocardiopsis algeriensis]|uniref:TM2 domain-containing membrane protein YozV n=1 Tax=Nocardiopsis algeriensis TaxID=1478215 RepID=A0A841ILH1_9ACTN|nr:TM2 domain-containing protein [Nocardiopsis algeriensis]MBB6118864.1 TM2 domain-containing membrane protein YozV [Nocardiopsis algeriensis]
MAAHYPTEPVSDKDWLVTLLLTFLVGGFGVHRFYVGKIGTGVLMLLTCGALGIWTLIDLIMVIVGNFKDAQGRPIRRTA